MGRKAKPIPLKVLEGNPGRRPIPKDAPEFISDMPEPPEYLDDYALEVWNRIGPGLYNLKLLSDYNRELFAAYCEACSDWRAAAEELNELKKESRLAAMTMTTSNGNIIQHTLIGVKNKARKDMISYGGEFGLSPSQAARLGKDFGESKKQSKFAGLINGGKK